MAGNMKVTWGSGSMPCWRPMIVLQEKGLKYDDKLISFGQKEHKSEENLKLNPRGQVPVFQDGDIVICESNAICDYLESSYQEGTRLVPSEKKEKACVLQRMHEVMANLFEKMQRELIYYAFSVEEIDEAKAEEKRKVARGELQTWEGYLSESEYVAGSKFSMADVYFFPFVAFGVRCGMKLDQFPKMKAYYEKLKERASIKATWPPHWISEENKNEKLLKMFEKL